VSNEPPILVTGANGHLGRALLRAMASGTEVRALVRSERAAGVLRELPEDARPELGIVAPGDTDALARAADGCARWIHLVGILKEGATARYEEAHEHLAERVARAAAKAAVERIVYLSILGARPDAENACLASKGRAEEILASGNAAVTVLRVPMVLGPDEIPAMALRAKALAPVTFLTRGGASLEQPIDTRDVVAAIRAAANEGGGANHALDLAGPESLSHRALVERVAALFGRTPRIVPLPLGVVMSAAALLERLSANPPVTRAMLGVLEHDDDIDPMPAARKLGISLTAIDDTLRFTWPEAGRKGTSMAEEA
jgi:NADH dehydrogenase